MLPRTSTLTVTGAVDRELQVDVAGLVPDGGRTDITADFHCVTTWTVRDLQWSGLAFSTFWRDVVVPACAPAPGAQCIAVEGLDGARAVLLLADALASDVVLADRLFDRPLDLAHGAPLRLVSPRQYGYKSIKHVHRIEVHLTPPPSTYGPKEHLRARAAIEERHSTIAPRPLRWVYRPLVPLTALVSSWTLRREVTRVHDSGSAPLH